MKSTQHSRCVDYLVQHLLFPEIFPVLPIERCSVQQEEPLSCNQPRPLCGASGNLSGGDGRGFPDHWEAPTALVRSLTRQQPEAHESKPEPPTCPPACLVVVFWQLGRQWSRWSAALVALTLRHRLWLLGLPVNRANLSSVQVAGAAAIGICR